jgi:hypothetical protein
VFQDTAAEENAYAALKVPTMKDDQIDEYIAHFEVLLVKAGWQRHEKGSMDMFFNGLTKNMQRRILSVYSVLPTTLDEWQSAARQIVQQHRLINAKIGPYKPNFQSVMTMGSQLPVMDSHYSRTITIWKHPRFCLRGTPMLILTTFQFPYHLRRALSPYMVQETLMADGSASEVLRTHVQRRGHSRLISSTSTAL